MTPESSSHTRLWVAVVASLFVSNGMAIGVWGGSLAMFRSRLGIGDSEIGLMLAAAGVFAVASMQASGRLSDRFGALKPALVGAGVLVAGLLLAAFAPTFAVLLAAGVVVGAGNGVMDIGMNALGVAVEKSARRPIMSRFHAMFSVGSFLGAGGVTLLGVFGLDERSVGWLPLVAVAAALVAINAAVALRAPHEAMGRSERAAAGRTKERIPTVAWLLGVMALGFGLTEGTAGDWSSIHVTDVVGVSSAQGAIGLTAVSLTMLAVRFAGDHLVGRFGRTHVVQLGSVAALAGYLGTFTLTDMVPVVISWAVVGAGVALLAPQVYALAGYLGGGRVMAIVTAFGYTAYLTGPAIIGFVSRAVGIQHAMVVPMISAVVVLVLAFAGALRAAERAGGLTADE